MDIEYLQLWLEEWLFRFATIMGMEEAKEKFKLFVGFAFSGIKPSETSMQLIFDTALSGEFFTNCETVQDVANIVSVHKTLKQISYWR